ncbi:MAG: cytochrome c oxidase subunit I, partial [Puniceicoccales bacterium]
TTGLGKIATAAFSLLTMAIAVPTGVKIFNWMGTLWGGRIKFTVPMVFSLGFIWMFMLGGFTGIMHSAAPADAQQQDSYFVVAHFHYVLLGGVLLGLLAGLYFWTPKIFGRMLNQKLGYWTAFLVIAGFNITFFPMHYLGLTGMPRRTHTYLGDMGWNLWNLVATAGAFILGIGVLLCFVNIVWTAIKGEKCEADPWDGRTLEWSTPTPVPAYNFARTPIVQARDCYWVHKHGDKKMEAMPDDGHGIHMPSQSWFPLLCGFGFAVFGVAMAMMGGGIPHAGWFAIGGLSTVFLGVYLWALEGPGGYHLEVPEEPNKKKEKGKSGKASAH